MSWTNEKSDKAIYELMERAGMLQNMTLKFELKQFENSICQALKPEWGGPNDPAVLKLVIEELQQRLTATDELADSWHSRCVERTTERDLLKERADVLEGLLRTSLLAMKRTYQAGYDRIIDAGGTCDTPEYMMESDPTVREIRAALKPTEGGVDEAF